MRAFTKVLSPAALNVPCSSYLGENALMLAIQCGHSEVVRTLIECGADIEHRLLDGRTPLLLAASLEHAHTLELLAKHGADFEARDEEGHSAIYLSSGSKIRPVVERLQREATGE